MECPSFCSVCHLVLSPEAALSCVRPCILHRVWLAASPLMELNPLETSRVPNPELAPVLVGLIFTGTSHHCTLHSLLASGPPRLPVPGVWPLRDVFLAQCLWVGMAHNQLVPGALLLHRLSQPAKPRLEGPAWGLRCGLWEEGFPWAGLGWAAVCPWHKWSGHDSHPGQAPLCTGEALSPRLKAPRLPGGQFSPAC